MPIPERTRRSAPSVCRGGTEPTFGRYRTHVRSSNKPIEQTKRTTTRSKSVGSPAPVHSTTAEEINTKEGPEASRTLPEPTEPAMTPSHPRTTRKTARREPDSSQWPVGLCASCPDPRGKLPAGPSARLALSWSASTRIAFGSMVVVVLGCLLGDEGLDVASCRAWKTASGVGVELCQFQDHWYRWNSRFVD